MDKQLHPRKQWDVIIHFNFFSIMARAIVSNYNMTVWILARNDINLSMAAGLIRLHMPGVK